MSPEELHAKLHGVDKGVCDYDLARCRVLAPLVGRIQALKKERDAVVLAHSYVAPEIIYGVADHVGDSYHLSEQAKKSKAGVIVFAAVRFMAETAKILNPGKTVLLPNARGGCTLADSIDADTVRRLRRRHPGFAFACYINTTAAVKAACDVCVTSSNVYDVVAALEERRVYFLPDRYMGQNLAEELARRKVDKEIRWYDGCCHAHEAYDPEMVEYVRLKNPGCSVAAHPECRPEVVAKADFTGSTEGILRHVRETDRPCYLLLTECGLSARVQAEFPGKKIVGICTMCRYMQGNTLEGIVAALEDRTGGHEVDVDPAVAEGARRCIERMFEVAGKAKRR